MKSWLCSIGWVAFAVCASVACGDDSSPGGAGGTGGSGGSGGSDSGVCANHDAGAVTTVACASVNECDRFTYTGTAPPVYVCNASKSTKYPDGPNACRNESDCAIINTGAVRDIVKTAALSCRDKEPLPGASEAERIAACNAETECNLTNVRKDTATRIMPPGISDECGKCYTKVALCSISFCLSQCAVSADDIECVKCGFESGCRLPYESCSGLDRME
jgi:hypothetical protein